MTGDLSRVGQPRGDGIRYADPQVIGIARGLRQDAEGQDRDLGSVGAGQGEPGCDRAAEHQERGGTPERRMSPPTQLTGGSRWRDALYRRVICGLVLNVGRLEAPDEPVALTRQSFYEFRRNGGVAKGLPGLLTAVFKPCSKSTNVSDFHSRSRKSSRVTTSPGRSSNAMRTCRGCSWSLTGMPSRYSSPAADPARNVRIERARVGHECAWQPGCRAV